MISKENFLGDINTDDPEVLCYKTTPQQMAELVVETHNFLMPEKPMVLDELMDWMGKGTFPGFKIFDVESKYHEFLLLRMIYGDASKEKVEAYCQVRDEMNLRRLANSY